MLANIIVAIANLSAGAIILLIGLYLRLSKNSDWLIAGYNTLSEKEKSAWNAAAMRRFIGSELIIVAAVLAAAGVLALFDFFPIYAIIASWCAFFIVIVSCLIYMNKSPRFRA